VAGATQTAISIAWDASSDNVGVTGYHLYRNGASVSTTTARTASFGGLTCGLSYTLGAEALDAAGNRSQQAVVTTRTDACSTGGASDTVPPSVPVGLVVAGVTASSISLSWAASFDNVAVAGYDIFANGLKIGVAAVPGHTVFGLSCGTSYLLAVAAFDAVGNRSPQVRLNASTAACAPPPPPPPPSSGAALAVSTSGNDSTCARGDLSKPCASFNRAYQLAQCGDSVQVAGGSYPAQSIIENSLSACSSNVVFQGSATVAEIRFGTGQAASNAADHVTLIGFTTSDVVMWGDADNIVVDSIDGGTIYIEGASNVVVRNSDLGPCDSAGNSNCRNFILDPPGQATTNNITFEDNTIHDFHLTVAGDHFEAFYTRGGGNIVFRGNHFWSNDTYHIRFENPRSWTVENNWFGDTCCNGGLRSTGGTSRKSSLEVGGSSNVLIRFNSFAPGQSVLTEKGAVSNVRIVGNVLGEQTCVPGAIYGYNVSLRGTCSATDRVVSTLPYVNSSVGAGGDYHLVAGSVAENFVGATGADYELGMDYDKQARLSVRDAGSDER